MPRSPARPCGVPGCPKTSTTGRCDDHKRPSDHQFSAFYRSHRWRQLSKRVRREQPTCAAPGCTAASAQADHIMSMSDGGAPLARANVQGLCLTHHEDKTWRDRAARRVGSNRKDGRA